MTKTEYYKQYYLKHKGEISKQHKEYYEENKEKRLKYQKEYGKEYYQTHKEEKLIKTNAYKKNNRDKINKRTNIKKQTDINFKLGCSLRDRLNKAIKNNQKIGSAVRDLGCSIPELKLYIESKFQEGMSWGNWGIHGWHIDHITPLDFFNLQNREEFLKAVNYENLQPLWAEENLKKHNKNAKNINSSG